MEAILISGQQRHLWRAQRAARTPRFRSECAVVIDGRLDLDTFQAAWQMLIRRHEILRRTLERAGRGAGPVVVDQDAARPDGGASDNARIDSLFHRFSGASAPVAEEPLAIVRP